MKAGRQLPDTFGGWAVMGAIALAFTAAILLVTHGSPEAERSGRGALLLIWGVGVVLFLDWLVFRRRGK